MTVTNIRAAAEPRAFDCGALQWAEILERYPISYRQLNFWTTSGRTHHQCFHNETGCGHTWFARSDLPPITCGCKRYTGPEPLPTVLP